MIIRQSFLLDSSPKFNAGLWWITLPRCRRYNNHTRLSIQTELRKMKTARMLQAIFGQPSLDYMYDVHNVAYFVDEEAKLSCSQ